MRQRVHPVERCRTKPLGPLIQPGGGIGTECDASSPGLMDLGSGYQAA
jgi:hypothetical protein